MGQTGGQTLQSIRGLTSGLTTFLVLPGSVLWTDTTLKFSYRLWKTLIGSYVPISGSRLLESGQTIGQTRSVVVGQCRGLSYGLTPHSNYALTCFRTNAINP